MQIISDDNEALDLTPSDWQALLAECNSDDEVIEESDHSAVDATLAKLRDEVRALVEASSFQDRLERKEEELLLFGSCLPTPKEEVKIKEIEKAGKLRLPGSSFGPQSQPKATSKQPKYLG